jgi:hypothetical protein
MNAQELLHALAVQLGLPGLALSPQGTAQLLVDASLALNLEHEPAADCLHTYLALGPLPPPPREPLLAALLLHNAFGQGTGGGSLALTAGGTPQILLQRRFELDGLTPQRLASALEALLDAAQHLQAELPQLAQQTQPAVEASAPHHGAMLRA